VEHFNLKVIYRWTGKTDGKWPLPGIQLVVAQHEKKAEQKKKG